jgi:uncharacterized protein (TIGR01777 family)
MNILLTGGTGFIGKKLGERLVQKGHQVFVVTRNVEEYRGKLPYPCQFLEWNQLENILPSLEIDVVVHLAGESVAQRWTSKVKKRIRDSRIETTKQLVKALEKNEIKAFIAASGIGFYGDRGEEILTEESKIGKTFLSQVCGEWEKENSKIKLIKPQTRLAIFRIGLVLGEGGALRMMLPIFKLGLGSALGNGKMWMSWIHIDDLVEMFVWAVENSNVSGAYNAVSPNPIRNMDFSRLLAGIFNKGLLPAPPKFILKIVLGEMAELVLTSQNAQPQRALQGGFPFQYYDIEEALRSVVKL